MKKYRAVFERHEKKYALTADQFETLANAFTPCLQQDQYGLHTICSLYLDTDDFAVIRTSLAKPVYKEKMRLRSYGMPQDDTTVFLELKKKLNGVVYKRRIALPYREADAYLADGTPPTEQSQIFGEIDWYFSRQALSPKMLLCYDRRAYFGKEDNDLRLTADFGIRWRTRELDLTKGDWGRSLMGKDFCLVEIKANGPFPLWLSKLLAQQKLYPISFSKYGTAYEKMLREKLPQLAEKEGMRRAG